jgi:hypothetical protein
MTKIRVHNPCNQYTKNYRYYNYFWDVLTEYLKTFFEVEENRYYELAHSTRFRVNLEHGISQNFELLECEYLIENLENGEFVIMSVADCVSSGVINEKSNPLLKKVIMSQFIPIQIENHVHEYMYKYSPWIYFQASVFDLEPYYQKRITNPPTENKLYFKGTSLDDRTFLNYIDKDIITPFYPITMKEYFSQIINHKIALSIDGIGELCYRDIECFAVGVPIIRFEYLSKMYNELIPNYHYISIPRPIDMGLYRLGTQNHAEILQQKYYEVLNNTEFLNFISKNARKYYEDNCAINNILKNTFNLLNLNMWL